MHIVAPALKAVGVNVTDLTLSTTSVYRARKTVRRSINNDIRDGFSPNTPLIAHFDGKRLPDTEGISSDRMPIVVSGKNIEKLLAIPKLPGAGTGVLMGNTVVQTLREWDGVPEWLAGLCFDTTSSNTGIHTGAITVIQRAFEKRLLFLACRHHIHEIIAAAIFDLFFVSYGPQIAIFGRFKNQWPSVDQLNYASMDKDTDGCVMTNTERVWLEQNRQSIVQFLLDQLRRNAQPRQDYIELLKLSLVALGVNDNGINRVHFSPPGAYHRARWMAKGIYCLKMFCFREQFKMNPHELQALRRICLFTVTVYVRAWFSAPDSCSAPWNDLTAKWHRQL